MRLLHILPKVLATGIFALGASSCLSQHSLTTDGQYWKLLSAIDKVVLAQAFIAGYHDGFINATSKVAIAADPQRGLQYKKLIATDSTYDPGRLTWWQLSDGIDACYKDSRNEALNVSVCAEWATYGVLGMADGQREAMLEGYRKVAAKSAQDTKTLQP